MAGVTPRQIWDALIKAGASSTQAAGIMGNMFYESSWNPEAINSGDPNGGSFGLVQENGSQYAGLVTNHPYQDMLAQIRVIGVNGGFQAASGSTPQQAGANFAVKYERCTLCTPGGSQTNLRAAKAAQVAGIAQSGKWPKSHGFNLPPGSTGAGGLVGSTYFSNCLIQGPTFTTPKIPLLGGGNQVGGICLFTRSEARALIGGLLIAAGGLTFLVGTALLAAVGLKSSGAAKAAGRSLEAVGAGVALVPGAEAAGAGLAVAGHKVAKAGQAGAAQRAQGRAQKVSKRTTPKQAAALSSTATVQTPPAPAPARPGPRRLTPAPAKTKPTKKKGP